MTNWIIELIANEVKWAAGKVPNPICKNKYNFFQYVDNALADSASTHDMNYLNKRTIEWSQNYKGMGE